MPFLAITWLAVLLPALGVLAGFLTDIPRRAAQATLAFTAAGFFVSLLVLGERLTHIDNNPYQSVLTFWLVPGGTTPFGDVPAFQPQVGVLADHLSAVLLPVVSLVALIVLAHSLGSMREDPGYRRYFALVGVTTSLMLALVASPNLFQGYICWEGLGICAYLLIGHWHERPAAARAARRVFIVTKIGDVALLLAIVAQYAKLAPHVNPGGSAPPPGLDVADPFNILTLVPEWGAVAAHQVTGSGTRTLVVLAIMFLIAALVRSAQVPFHSWITEVAEAPPAAIALLLSSTFAVGGVFLITRLYSLFLIAPHVLTALAVIGGCTAVVGALCAVVQNDVRLLLVWSTVGHLGLMMVALGTGAFSAAVLHLIAHAWFTALLLLCMANVAMAYGTYDMREMGDAWRRMRVTCISLLVGCCSSAGVVFVGGFWSQGAILSGVLRDELPTGLHVNHGIQAFLVFAVLVAFTAGAVAPFRMFFRVALSAAPRRRGFSVERVREARPSMSRPLVALAVAAVLSGFIGIEGVGPTLGRFVYAVNPNVGSFHVVGMALAAAAGLTGAAVAYALVLRPSELMTRVTTRLHAPGLLLASGLRGSEMQSWLGRRAVSASKLPSRFDAVVVDGLGAAVGDGLTRIGVWTHRLRGGSRLQIQLAGAVAGVVAFAGIMVLAATGHLPGVGGAR